MSLSISTKKKLINPIRELKEGTFDIKGYSPLFGAKMNESEVIINTAHNTEISN